MVLYKIPNNSPIAVNSPASLMARGRARQPRSHAAGRRAAPGNFCEDSGSGQEFNFTPMDEHTPDGDILDAPR